MPKGDQTRVVTDPPEGDPFSIEYTDEDHEYRLIPDGTPGFAVPGCSTIAKIVGDGIPPWWGMKVGVEGVQHLLDKDVMAYTTEEWIDLLKEHELTVNHTRDKAAYRGTAVHRLLGAEKPDMRQFTEEERGYARSYWLWVEENNPEFLAVEQLVGDPFYRFGGQYDARVRLAGGEWLIDLKTTTRIYPEHHYQLAGYELGARACGEEPTRGQYVVRLKADGGYPQVERVVANGDDFIDALTCWNSLQGLKAARKDQRERDKAAA